MWMVDDVEMGGEVVLLSVCKMPPVGRLGGLKT